MSAETIKVPKLLTEREVAEILRISVCTLQRRRRNGEITARRIGAGWMYTEADILEYQERQKVVAWRESQIGQRKLPDFGYPSAPTPQNTMQLGTTTTVGGIDRHAASRLAQTIFKKPS
uniref:helix-turn-helix domain-containing protein n=1 Tax=Brucella pseudintermedia TaxID=370111 RepID=UPI0039A6421E